MPRLAGEPPSARDFAASLSPLLEEVNTHGVHRLHHSDMTKVQPSKDQEELTERRCANTEHPASTAR